MKMNMRVNQVLMGGFLLVFSFTACSSSQDSTSSRGTVPPIHGSSHNVKADIPSAREALFSGDLDRARRIISEISQEIKINDANRDSLSNLYMRLSAMEAASMNIVEARKWARASNGLHGAGPFGSVLAENSENELDTVGSCFIGVKAKTLDGEEFSSDDAVGRIVLYDFWVTSCGICKREYPCLSENYKKYHDKGFEIVQVCCDRNENELRGYLDKHSSPWIHIPDTKGVVRKPFALKLFPTMILVDEKRRVVSMFANSEVLYDLLAFMIDSSDEVKRARLEKP